MTVVKEDGRRLDATLTPKPRHCDRAGCRDRCLAAAGLVIAGATAGLFAVPMRLCAEPVVADTVYQDSSNLKYGVRGPSDTLLNKHYYVINYCCAWRIPYWSAYFMCAESLYGKEERKESFFQEDKSLPVQARSTRADYKYSGFNRGHIAPAAMFQRNHEAYVRTYLLSNMSPQYRRFNSGIWQTLESQLRTMIRAKESVWVVTGNAFLEDDGRPADPDTCWWLGEDDCPRVAIPTHLFAAALARAPDGGFSAYAFLIPNCKDWNKEQPSAFRLSVDSLEKLVGYDFFPALPDEVEDAVETEVLPWEWKKER